MSLELMELRLKALHKTFKKVLIGVIIAVVILLVVKTFWDHFIIDILAGLSMVPLFVYQFKMYQVEKQIYAIKPQSDFPLFQRDETQYKKIIKFLVRLTLISFILMVSFVLAKAFIRLDWISNEMPEGIDAVIFATLVIAAFAAWTKGFVEMMRKQYVKYYQTDDTVDEKAVEKDE